MADAPVGGRRAGNSSRSTHTSRRRYPAESVRPILQSSRGCSFETSCPVNLCSRKNGVIGLGAPDLWPRVRIGSNVLVRRVAACWNCACQCSRCAEPSGFGLLAGGRCGHAGFGAGANHRQQDGCVAREESYKRFPAAGVGVLNASWEKDLRLAVIGRDKLAQPVPTASRGFATPRSRQSPSNERRDGSFRFFS